jgi:Tol biopolymer transport system component
MAIQIGQQLGSLEVTALLGKGGMGEVYRARDTKLKRDVAIKILPDEFARDADRVNRFQREAEVLASLSHPNIAGIYDLQHSGDTQFLIMELVEGETLADRIKRGPIPVEDALQIGKSICEALDAAHEKGIVHRDLKPANVKIAADGTVKVLDFGLAKAMESGQGPTPLSNSPTIVRMAATNAGVILGTAAYMSPEQAKGKAVDKRADIWAFGVVLYEMLTGRMLFSAETTSETIAAVMMKEPDWTALPANTRTGVLGLLRRCLTKEPRNRLRDIGEARIAIEGLLSGVETAGDVGDATPRRRSNVWAGITAVLLLTTIVFAALWVVTFNRAAPPEIRVDVNTPASADPVSFAISPDGRRLVYASSNEGKSQLWLRPLDAVSAQPLAGTEGAKYPFWSPDNTSIGFFADGKLKRLDIVSGASQVLANASNGRGGAWNSEGTILFTPLGVGPLFKVPSAGGDPVAVTRLETGQSAHKFPQFLPDGRHFVYLVQSGTNQGVYAGSLDGDVPKRLTNADAPAVVSPSGFLLFPRQTTLFAQAFDFKRQELLGNPFPLAQQAVIPFEAGILAPGYSAGAGIVAYRSGTAGLTRQLVWLDRSGKRVGAIGATDTATLTDVQLSPDEKRVATYRTVNGNVDVWIIDTVRGIRTRLTFETAFDILPIWSSDGSRVAFSSNRKGTFSIWSRLSSGAGAEEQLVELGQSSTPSDWSADGRFLLFRNIDPQTATDLWVLPLFGDKKPFPFLKTPFEDYDGQFSPDGRWIAYASNESGRFEIYVQPFPGPGGKLLISADGGLQPRWNKNGKEIFYISLDSKMMAVPVKLSQDGKSLRQMLRPLCFRFELPEARCRPPTRTSNMPYQQMASAFSSTSIQTRAQHPPSPSS